MRIKKANIFGVVNIKDSDGNKLRYTIWFCQKATIDFIVSFCKMQRFL